MVGSVKLAIVLFNLGGPDSPESRRAVPAQSLFRSGDHFACPGSFGSRWPGGSHGGERPWRGRSMTISGTLADPGGDTGARRGLWKRSWIECRDLNVKAVCRHALLASLQRWRGCGGKALWRRTRSCCCRSIRNFPPPPVLRR